MTKEQLQQLHCNIWWDECADFLEEDFFKADKQIRFLGESRYYKLEPFIEKSPPTLIELIMYERAYRDKRIKIIPADELNKIYLEETLKMSREREDKLIRKMTARNSAVGDIDKAKQYPIDQLIEIKHGFAKCLWHTEKQASMKYYEKENRAHCFSCGKSFDSIDIAQKVWGLSFKETIKKLTI